MAATKLLLQMTPQTEASPLEPQAIDPLPGRKSSGLGLALLYPAMALLGIVFFPTIHGLGFLLVASQLPVVLRKNLSQSIWVIALALLGLIPLALRQDASLIVLPLYATLIVMTGLSVMVLIRSEQSRDKKYRKFFIGRKQEYEKLESREENISRLNKKMDSQLIVHTRMYEGIRRMLEEKLSIQDFTALSAEFLRRVGGIRNYLVFALDPSNGEKLVITRALGTELTMLRDQSVPLKSGTVMDLLWRTSKSRLYSADDMDVAFSGLSVPSSFRSLLVDSFDLGGQRMMVLVCSEKRDGLGQDDRQRLRTLLDNLSLAWKKTSLYVEVERLSRVDGLTGLTSRRRFNNLLESELERAQRYGLTFGLAMADLDHFKNVNDTYGHLAGDEVLRQIGNLFLGVIGRPHVAARIGGEEIACLFSQETEENVVSALEKLRSKIEKHPMATGRVMKNGEPEIIQLTASFGVSFFPKDGKNAEDLMQAADSALYKAKKSGRNSVIIAES